MKAETTNWDFPVDALNGFVPAHVAKKLLNCQTTTLYYLRKNKKLVYSKLGAKVFYSLESIRQLLKDNIKQ